MNLRLLFIFAIILLSSAVPGIAGFVLDLDFASFRANDTLSYVEIYCSIQRSRLLCHPQDSLKAEFRVALAIADSGTNVLADTFAAADVFEQGERPAEGQFFPHIFKFVMRPGVYAVRASLFQYNDTPRDVVTDSLTVRAFRANEMSMSDVELGCDISFVNEPSPFAKNGVRLLPNPTRFFGTKLPLFCYYAEVYGFEFDSAATDSYTVTRRILRGETGQAARPENTKTYRLPKSEVVIADGFPVSALKTGTYYLELEVKNSRTGQSALSRKKFWTYRAEDFAAGSVAGSDTQFQHRILQSDPNVLEVLDPDSALRTMRYVLTKEESNRVKRLTPEGKREFLLSYWRDREVNDTGAANRYFARVVEANSRYSFFKKPGWLTDQGRVFVMYGEPDQVERNYSRAEIPDHELWRYDRLEGGVYFIFMDKNGFGELDVVHSTMRGEIYYPNWQMLAPSTHTDPTSPQRR
jgi:GWxTD domain-containing protein